MKALWRLYEGSMKALWRLYEGSTKALWRLYEGSIKALTARAATQQLGRGRRCAWHAQRQGGRVRNEGRLWRRAPTYAAVKRAESSAHLFVIKLLGALGVYYLANSDISEHKQRSSRVSLSRGRSTQHSDYLRRLEPTLEAVFACTNFFYLKY